MAHNFAMTDFAPSQNAMGGLRSKDFMRWSTKGSLPGPESTLEAPASQDAQMDPVVL